MLKKRTIHCIATAALLTASGAKAGVVLSSQLGVLDLTANAGVNPATGAAWQAGDTYRLVFLSSTETTAVSDSLASYDSAVQALANASSISTLGDVTWQAIVSGESTDARDHTNTNPGTDGASTSVWLINGTEIIGDDYDHFWTDRVTAGTPRAIDRTESNSAPGSNDGLGGWDTWRGTWTGTNGDGTINGTGIDGATPRVGLATSGWTGTSSSSWVSRGTGADTDTYRLYAISEELTVVPEPSSLALLGLGGLLIARRRRGW